MSDFGIYIHWPFCKSKCPYCDFLSRVKKNVAQDTIIDSYIKDILFYAQKTNSHKVTSIFFGGGTPSLLSPHNVERVIDAVAKNWRLSTDVEISMEANPNTENGTLFSDLHLAGINRISLGIQSLNDDELKFLGRTHNASQAIHALETALKIFDNCSADLIYALPQQSMKEWNKTLQKILSYHLGHLSLYQLTIEENTVFAKKGILPLNEEAAADMYLSTTNTLQQNGFEHYEISNYAQPNRQCRHNLLYWQGDDYVGIGEGAHGRLRIENHFYATTHHLQLEELTATERAEELLLMGLRLRSGINKQKFYQNCGLNLDDIIDTKAAKDFVSDGLLINTPQNLKITSSGLLVTNKIIEELI